MTNESKEDKTSDATSGQNEPVVMCCCKSIEIGSYDNQLETERPSHMLGRTEGSSGSTICIDRCILEEVKALWSLGITTTGCCCGHNKKGGYIGVIDSDIDVMKMMGYEVHKNKLRPNDEDSFSPLSQYCPICQKTISPSNLGEVLVGEHDGYIFMHDDIDHQDDVIGMIKN